MSKNDTRQLPSRDELAAAFKAAGIGTIYRVRMALVDDVLAYLAEPPEDQEG